MSDPEGFLTRWSRRKREAEEAAPLAPAKAGQPHEPTAPVDADDATPPRPKQADPPAAELPPVDLAALPPIESITAVSDIRAFLAPGVPLQLTRAALRRVWVADPAIRDFVGLAENAWDFNDPDSVPGFGSALSSEEAQRLIAQALGLENPPPAAPPADGEPVQNPDVTAAREAVSEPTVVEEASVSERTGNGLAESNDLYAAVRKEEAPDDRPQRMARHHGGALPR